MRVRTCVHSTHNTQVMTITTVTIEFVNKPSTSNMLHATFTYLRHAYNTHIVFSHHYKTNPYNTNHTPTGLALDCA